MRERKTAVVFDMDGVIFDSERAQMAVWFALAEEAGLLRFDFAEEELLPVPCQGEGLAAGAGHN